MSKIKESSTNFANKQALANHCSEVYASIVLGGQWSIAICSWLANGKLRFCELKKILPNITERMLTLQLKKLEEQKIISRTVYPEVPPRVEYELTAIGYELIPIIKMLESWGEKHKKCMGSCNSL
ncbi:winged helix-turn-helix transcriptional regulator [Mucilaginibacter pedocola]|uniref:Transcriptional regulator n=1 Tax=Mucilaginibacter pedocola TaxID=1792845 RepID=A0A1S9PEY6_9SPHI|nr:helix-turn-helix domain-containing protein [Mucilaginibacter pedocola]OOQ59525.1 transcriptional regulator [Mucilaginibacter pedocola]